MFISYVHNILYYVHYYNVHNIQTYVHYISDNVHIDSAPLLRYYVHAENHEFTQSEKGKTMNDKYKYQYEYARTKLKRIPLDLRLEDYQKLKEYCDSSGIPINTYIKQLIYADLKKMNKI